MPKLPDGTVLQLARSTTDEAMERLEQHIDAHPLRYGRELPDEAYDEIRGRIDFELHKVFRDLEVPPR